jgi:type IV secretory pathway VirB4 component
MYKYIGQNVIYIDKKYLEVKDFPTFEDLRTELKKTSEIEPKIKKNIINTIEKLNCKLQKSETDIKLIVFDFSKLKKEKFKLYMNIFFETLKELEEDETIIYIDEIWKCVSFGSDETLTNKIYDMFKTLRKKKMGIVSITQDIYDFFTYQDGLFGKSILNNSYNKVIFNLQYVEVKEIKKIIEQKEEDINKIKLFEKGKALMQIGGSRFEVKVKASNWEHEIIEGRKTNENSISSIE